MSRVRLYPPFERSWFGVANALVTATTYGWIIGYVAAWLVLR